MTKPNALDAVHARHLNHQKYDLVEWCIKGTFCQVLYVKHKVTEQSRAVKIIDRRNVSADPLLTNQEGGSNHESQMWEDAQRNDVLADKTVHDTESQWLSYKDLAKQYLAVAANRKKDAEIVSNVLSMPNAEPTKDAYVKSELRMAEVLLKSPHPNLVKVFNVFKTDAFFYIYMEYCDGGTLHEYVTFESKQGTFIKENLIRFWVKQIAAALYYLHTVLFIAHRDLKLDNIGLDQSMKCKLLDFGFACSTRDESIMAPEKYSRSLCGTRLYMGPEVMTSYKKNSIYDATKADMYSLGICIYVLFTDRFPYTCNLYDNILKEWYKQNHVNSRISMIGYELLDRLLCPFPSKRFTALQVLGHPFASEHKGNYFQSI